MHASPHAQPPSPQLPSQPNATQIPLTPQLPSPPPSLNIDGTGKCVTQTPVGFLNHMLDQIASHGLFDLYVAAEGDTWIDDHHTVEDIALAFGGALSQVRFLGML